MVVLHQFHMSPFNEKLQRMMRFKGVAFEENYWRLTEQGKLKKKHNPTGKLPALEHDGHWVCDSTDVAHYIEENFPGPRLIPEDPAAAGLVHALEDWADESLYFYEMHMRFTTDRNWERNLPRMFERECWFMKSVLAGKMPGQIRKGIRKITGTQGIGRKTEAQLLVDCRRHISAVAGMLNDSDFLVAGQLTLADLAVYAMFLCFLDTEELASIMSEYAAVGAWMSRVEQLTDG
ncbi:glutathione S-transferase family protein [Halioglobus maricola]|uniref:Glutathione S-transferase family protein n=1 Tax=Halioglobus maricola TaxID=2601894 RepID=A0A5P9NJ30_9GAMM|nr:glutathione S-transferase family protein [Halioglobus maricola]QFU75840.1 glutathione S-transferase family protein [Halioglobus maricola]